MLFVWHEQPPDAWKMYSPFLICFLSAESFKLEQINKKVKRDKSFKSILNFFLKKIILIHKKRFFISIFIYSFRIIWAIYFFAGMVKNGEPLTKYNFKKTNLNSKTEY